LSSRTQPPTPGLLVGGLIMPRVSGVFGRRGRQQAAHNEKTGTQADGENVMSGSRMHRLVLDPQWTLYIYHPPQKYTLPLEPVYR